MTHPATTAAETSDAAFRERANIAGDLGEHLCQHLWSEFGTLRLGGQEFEMAGDDVPGYEDDDGAVLLRRTSDGQVFEAEIDVTVRPVREARQPEAAASSDARRQQAAEGITGMAWDNLGTGGCVQ